MVKITTPGWRTAALLLLLMLTACNPVGEDSADGAGAGTQAIPSPQPRALAELVDVFARGDGKIPVLEWITREQPRSEAYSFIEYGVGQHRGHAYRWGGVQSPHPGSCAVYLLWDYTPVQLSFDLAWYSDISGIDAQLLKQQCLELLAQLDEVDAGTQHDIRVREGWRIARGDGVDVQFYDNGEHPVGFAMFTLSLTATQAAQVMARNARFIELREYASEDTPTTLRELVDLAAAEGARGILQRYDFSEFEQLFWYEPLDGSDSRDYGQTTMYLSGTFRWSTGHLAYLSAFDDGKRMQLLFTPSWYTEHNGIGTDELAAEFTGMLDVSGGKRVVFDADNDAYDVEFAYCYVDGVNVVRRLYLNAPGDGGHMLYTLYVDEEMFPEARDALLQGEVLLPPEPEDAGAVELLLREMIRLPVAELQWIHIVGFQREDVNIPPHKTTPFSTRQVYSYDAPTTRRRLAVITLLDESYRESFQLTPAWLGSKLGLEPAVVEQEFTALAAAHGVRDGQFDYGQLRINLHPGQRDDGTDTWYVCEFPTWP